MSEQRTAMTVAAEAIAAFEAGASKDQLASAMLSAAVCLSVEALGMLATIDSLFDVLKVLAQETPQEVAALRRMHSNHTLVFTAYVSHWKH
jgi:hypothetical protein